LGHAAKVFAKGSLPVFGGSWVMHQVFIAAYGFAHHWVYHWHRDLGKVQAGGGSFRLLFGWGANVWQVFPKTIGEKIDCLLQSYPVLM
jgi:hypothetical protein